MVRAVSLLLCLSVPGLAFADSAPGAASAPPVAPTYPPSYPPSSEPAPPAYPPAYPPDATAQPQPNLQPQPGQPQPQPQPNLQPYGQRNPLPAYQPTKPQGQAEGKSEGKSEMVLMGAEFFASAGVTLLSTLAVGSLVLGSATNPSADAGTAELVLLLYLGLIPIVSSLPVWLIGLLSDKYQPSLSPAIEGGSVIASIALVIVLVTSLSASQSTQNTGLDVAGGLLIVGMPLVEVISMNLSKVPKGMGMGMGGFFSERTAPLYSPPPTSWALSMPKMPMPGQVLMQVPLAAF
jgi:hypothetical protein